MTTKDRNGTQVPVAAKGDMVTQTSMGETSLDYRAETASTAVAEQARAEVQAFFSMAIARPRDMDRTRQVLLKESKRPGFARAARYYLPVGGGVSGPTVRFAEAAVKALGNVSVSARTLYDDDEKRIIRVSVVDMESCVPYSRDVTVTKIVERQKLRKGQVPIASRTNSQGQTVYVVEAGETELAAKEGALISKAMRTLALKLLPGDILDECMEQVQRTINDENAQDPDAAKKRVADAFASIGVPVDALKLYLGHPLDSCTPAELTELRSLYTAIKEGHATWDDAIEAKHPEANGGKDEAPVSDAAKRLREQLEKARKPEPVPNPHTDEVEPRENGDDGFDPERDADLVGGE